MGLFHKFRYFNRSLALSCSLIAVSTFNYGFDNQAFASTQAMDAFEKQFGVYDPAAGTYALEPYWLSLFNSLNYIGLFVGVMAGTTIASRWGRKRCMFVMSVYALLTATLAVTSQSREQIMAARILNYIYVGIELAVVPMYQSEIGKNTSLVQCSCLFKVAFIANHPFTHHSSQPSPRPSRRILPAQPDRRRPRHQLDLPRDELDPGQPGVADPAGAVLRGPCLRRRPRALRARVPALAAPPGPRR